MPTELKPCPFCGGGAELIKQYRLDGQTHYEVAKVRCPMCKCQTDDYILNGYYGSTDTVQNAFQAWNRRARTKTRCPIKGISYIPYRNKENKDDQI